VSDIFISYASADRSRIRPLVDELHRRGWSVWWDRTIPPGKTWDRVIEAALAEARCVIVLWSRASVQSDWVLIEAHHAKGREILVPALLDDVTIPFAFSRIQAANLIEWRGVFPNAEFDELARAVAAVLSRDITPAPETTRRPAPAPPPVPPTPATMRPRHAFLPIIGATVFACVVGLASYFVDSHREASKSPSASSAPSQVREEAKVEPPVLRPSVPSDPGPVAGHNDNVDVAKTAKALLSSNPEPVAGRPQVLSNSKDGLNYVFIPAGNFIMGCSSGDNECESDDNPPHPEQIANGFWLGQTEVTQAAWKKVNSGYNPSHFKGGQLPAETVDWNQASAYCKAIGGRLPTEKEWEYAARAGTAGPRYGALDAVAWFSVNSGSTTHPVGSKQANVFGLYDMLGNVEEWTADNYVLSTKVIRGGSWFNEAWLVRATHRAWGPPTSGDSDLGFRCVGELR
jgi:formylglycine-generating enzyme required for sulfatase activity